jgi:trk system potassium uptake protein TrkH
MSTLSTGGFSTRNNGIAAFTSPWIRTVITLFMFLAATNISLFYFAAKRNYRKIFQNDELKIYTVIVLTISVVVSVILFFHQKSGPGGAVSDGFFHVISILTTTGYYTTDYSHWGSFPVLIIIILMFIGGMTGSASGGIKITRLIIVIKNSRSVIRRLVHPSAYLPVRVEHRIIPENIVINLLVFTAIYLIMACLGTLVISMMDYDILTSLSTSISMLGNIGPGVGTFGPFSSFTEVSNTGKLLLSGLMLTGRMELLAVMVFFTRSFYKK